MPLLSSPDSAHGFGIYRRVAAYRGQPRKLPGVIPFDHGIRDKGSGDCVVNANRRPV